MTAPPSRGTPAPRKRTERGSIFRFTLYPAWRVTTGKCVVLSYEYVYFRTKYGSTFVLSYESTFVLPSYESTKVLSYEGTFVLSYVVGLHTYAIFREALYLLLEDTQPSRENVTYSGTRVFSLEKMRFAGRPHGKNVQGRQFQTTCSRVK